jgi:hypothetical protein
MLFPTQEINFTQLVEEQGTGKAGHHHDQFGNAILRVYKLKLCDNFGVMKVIFDSFNEVMEQLPLLPQVFFDTHRQHLANYIVKL